MHAIRAMRQGGAVQRIWSGSPERTCAACSGGRAGRCRCRAAVPGRVSASIRAIEITHGENGWHPHVHFLLRTTEWTEADRDALQARWEREVVRALGSECRPDDLHGLAWSEPFDAKDAASRPRYLAKLGLEIVGIAKEGRRSSRSTWAVARDAADGDSRSVALWREFLKASRGRRMLEMDERAAEYAEQPDELHAAGCTCGECKRANEEPRDVTPPEPTFIEVTRDDLRAIIREERCTPSVFALLLAMAERDGPERVREEIALYRARHGPPAAKPLERWEPLRAA